jgi:Zn-dependent membrane protease YugP
MIYILLIAIAVAAILGPQLWAARILNRYNREEYFSGNGMELARMLLDELNLKDVVVEENQIGDHYNPEKKVVSLTKERCGRRSLTAVVVAAHEVGHAIQDHSNYLPLQARNRLVVAAAKFERFGAIMMIAVPLLVGLVRVPSAWLLMLIVGLATLCVPLLVHIVTLPTEFDASFNRAMPLLASGKYIPEEDIPAARTILLACALTYVANALAGLLNIWRWIRILRR